MEYLSKIDAFGIRPSLLTNTKPKYQTIFGGTLSIVLGIIMVISFYLLGKELVEKKTPSVNLSTEYINHPERLNFSGNFEFLLSLQNKNKSPEVDESIYYVKAFVVDTVKKDGKTQMITKEINVETCDKVFPNSSLYSHVKGNFDFDNFYCLSFNQNNPSGATVDDLYINDSWGNDGFRMIQVKIYDCNETETPGKCKSKEEINNFLKNSSLTYFTFDNFVTTTNYTHPISTGIKEYFYYPSNEFYLAITDYLRLVKVNSDDGLVKTSYKTMTTFKHDHMYSYQMNYRDRPNFLSLTFQLVNERDEYDRKYYKLPDLAGQIGGIYKAVFLILVIISHFYNENCMYEHFFNHFFEVENEKDEDYHNIIAVDSKEETKGNVISLSSSKESHSRSILKQNSKLKLSCCSKWIMLNLFKCSWYRSRKNIILYNDGKGKICSLLEASNYLLKIHQVDMMKKILNSNNDKISNFDYIYTPVLSFCEDKGRYTYLLPERYTNELNNSNTQDKIN